MWNSKEQISLKSATVADGFQSILKQLDNQHIYNPPSRQEYSKPETPKMSENYSDSPEIKQKLKYYSFKAEMGENENLESWNSLQQQEWK